jgi:hypothetical protein
MALEKAAISSNAMAFVMAFKWFGSAVTAILAVRTSLVVSRINE